MTDTELLDFFEDASSKGYHPSLLQAYDGSWAVSFTSLDTEDFDVMEEWRPTVREAILHAVERVKLAEKELKEKS